MKNSKSLFLSIFSGLILLTGGGSAFASGTALEQLYDAVADRPAAYTDAVPRGNPPAALSGTPASSPAPSSPAAPALSADLKGTVPALSAEKSAAGGAVGGLGGFTGGFLLVMSPAIALGMIPVAGKILGPIAAVVLFVPAVVVGAVSGLIGALIGGLVA